MTTHTEEFPWENATPAAAPKGRKAAATGATIVITDLEPMAAGEGPPIEGVPRADLPAIRQSIEAQLTGLLTQADAIKVTSIDQTEEMAAARTCRLNIRQVRLHVEKKHKELKAYHLQAGREVDGFKNYFLELCEEREKRLQLAEDFAEIETARIEHEKRVARMAELQAYTDGIMPPTDLGKLTDEEWQQQLADAKDLKEVRVRRLEAARAAEEEARRVEAEKIEEERKKQIAIAEAARAAAEATRKENERLRAEAERVEAERAAERRKAQEEHEAREKKLQAERDAAEAERRAEREAAARERDEAMRKVNAERDRASEEARKAKEEARRKSDEHEKAIAAANAEAQRLQQEADRREAEQRLVEAKAKADAAEAARAAAAAPDKEKLKAYAATIAALVAPTLSAASKGTGELVAQKTAAFARWIIAEADKL